MLKRTGTLENIMDFNIDDLVWAKRKGFPLWPARIAKPDSSVKAPENISEYEYVKFFASNDTSWIQKEDIWHHSEAILNESKYKKMTSRMLFQEAIDELLDILGQSVKNEKQKRQKVVVENIKNPNDYKLIKTAPNKSQILNVKYCVERVPKLNKFVKGSQKEILDSELAEPNDPKDTYGLIGLNGLGRVILDTFLRYGIEVTLWDKGIDECTEMASRNKEIQKANSPAELIVKCDITFCCYGSDNDVYESIILGDDGILKGLEDADNLGLRPGYVGLAQVDLKTSGLIQEITTVSNAMYLEAVCGTNENAENQLIIHVSGDKILYLKCKKLFDLIASKCVYLGCDIGL